MRTIPRRAIVFAPALAALLLLAGCSGTPTTPEASGAGARSGNAGFQAARDAYDLKLAQCLRDAGFDVKDPAPGQGITEDIPGLNEAAGPCMAELGDPPRPDAQVDETEFFTTMLGWADCLRGRGLEVVDPQLGEAFVLPAEATDEDVAACIPPV